MYEYVHRTKRLPSFTTSVWPQGCTCTCKFLMFSCSIRTRPTVKFICQFDLRVMFLLSKKLCHLRSSKTLFAYRAQRKKMKSHQALGIKISKVNFRKASTSKASFFQLTSGLPPLCFHHATALIAKSKA